MKKRLFLLLLSVYSLLCMSVFAQETKVWKVSDESVSLSEIKAGGLNIALYINNTSATRYIGSGSNTTSFDAADGDNIFAVEKSGTGVKLKNLKSGEYIGGTGSTLARTSSATSAKVFTVTKISSKVDNTASGADETRSFYLSFTYNGTTYYLNTNVNQYNSVQYATGNGCWSVMYIYKVAQETVYQTNIIPVPKSVTVNAEGTLSTWSKDDIKYVADETLGEEAYVLDIKADGITVTSSSDTGKYYALLTLDQLAEGLNGSNGSNGLNGLPLLRIEDSPRFAYRGFMLDCSRHFFTVEEIKRMLDVMARYKMSVFHWHLTDDQGWRAEIKKYPKLTTTGATRSDSYETPITKIVKDGWTYWTGTGGYTGKQYGPYFYTQAEMKDVVAYAKERHIEVMPEIEMPGHMVAAMASYPEYSCTPNNPPTVWTSGGISSNVLNVGNEAAVEFAENILSEICSIFPYPYIHIGGDECPTTQWQSNSDCQALYSSLGLSSYRALQTHFTKQISDFVATKGKKLFCWNESVTASGTDTDIMKETGATIMCWNPCASGATKAVGLGLPAVITEYNRGSQSYYINRRQCTDYGEPTAAGDGDDSVEGCYSLVPMPSGLTSAQEALVKGVQGTFWAEHVGSPEYLEYLALPRLVCVAEAGWARQDQKDWSDFQRRMVVHTKWLEDNNYVYSQHWMPGYVHRTDDKKAVAPELSTEDSPKWYKLKLTNSATYIQSNGKTNLHTTASEKLDSCQFYQLIATSTTSPSTNSFKLKCADGTWVGVKTATATTGSSASLLYAAASKSTAKSFYLTTYPSDATKYVITTTSDKTKGINCWGGTGTGYNLGFYTTSDANCALVFQEDPNFPLEPTGIEEAPIPQPLSPSADARGKGSSYDLTGRKITTLQHGIYIINGRKVVR